MMKPILGYTEYQNLKDALKTVIERYGFDAVKEVIDNLAAHSEADRERLLGYQAMMPNGR